MMDFSIGSFALNFSLKKTQKDDIHFNKKYAV